MTVIISNVLIDIQNVFI